MSNPFQDQREFMLACTQTTHKFNENQYKLYLSLIEEERKELLQAIKDDDRVEQLDALVDLLVVTIGAIHSLGVDAQGAWDEVMDTNLAKIDSETGKVKKREDGKVLKPKDWTPPDLKQFFD